MNPQYHLQKVVDPDLKANLCEKVLRSLPEWFGIESAILDYINDVRGMETWSVLVDQAEVGFLSVNKHNTWTAEIHVMGVMPSFHGQGLGTQLLRVVEQELSLEGFQFLTVKTLSESRPNEEYDKTRKFYLRAGFLPLEEFKTLWGEANPCLMLIKTLSKQKRAFEFGQVHHIEYYVDDLQRSNHFWSWFLSALGYVKKEAWETGIAWSHGNGTYLVFVQVQDRFLHSRNTRQGNGLNHIAFMGSSRAELDQLQKNLEEREIKILKRKDDYLCFEDPNQFAVEVYANQI